MALHLDGSGRYCRRTNESCEGFPRTAANSLIHPLVALQTATTRPVVFFGLQRSLGSVAVGKRAEPVLLDGNPLQDLGNLDRVRSVLTHRKALLRPELDQMEEAVANAAQNYR